MAYDVGYAKDGDYVSVKLTGDVTFDDLNKARDETQVLLTANTVTRVLVEAKRKGSMPSVLEDYDFTSQLASYFPRRTKIALSITANQMEYMRFVESVAYNRGLNFKLFPDRDQALHWLLGV